MIFTRQGIGVALVLLCVALALYLQMTGPLGVEGWHLVRQPLWLRVLVVAGVVLVVSDMGRLFRHQR